MTYTEELVEMEEEEWELDIDKLNTKIARKGGKTRYIYYYTTLKEFAHLPADGRALIYIQTLKFLEKEWERVKNRRDNTWIENLLGFQIPLLTPFLKLLK